MFKNIYDKILIEDSTVGGDKPYKSEKIYGPGYDGFVYPYTVSFYGEGEYKVVIKGKKAMVKKVDI